MTKKIIIAKSAGFCWGVKRAFDKVMGVAKTTGSKKALYTYGPLIHNPEAVRLLEKEGVSVIDEIPSKIDGIVFVRTHGISPAERKRLRESGAVICDATCPDVGIIQGIVKKHLKKGYHIVIVGDSKHPEVKALLGFAEGNGIAISSAADLEKIPKDWSKICVVAQSTQKEERFGEISSIIKERFPEAIIFNTICRSTAHRQEEVMRLSKQVDAMIVVGGSNSANTNKLAEISREANTPTFQIESANDLDLDAIKKFPVIGITAGASTPRWSIEEVVSKIASLGNVEIEEFNIGDERTQKTHDAKDNFRDD